MEAGDALVSVLPLAGLLSHQNEDGSWGDLSEAFEGRIWTREEATALVLVTLLGAGYSHVSKEKLGDRDAGDAIKAGFMFLDRHPPADAGGTALVALALSELASLTESPKWRGQADAALARLAAWQCGDGTWAGDAVSTRFASMALASARIHGLLPLPSLAERAAAQVRDRLAAAPDADAAIQLLWLTQEFSDENRELVRATCLSVPTETSAPDYTGWYFNCLALYQADGPRGESWRTWGTAARIALIQAGTKTGWPRDGGATACAVRDALATMTLEVYYRYEFAPGVKAGAPKPWGWP